MKKMKKMKAFKSWEWTSLDSCEDFVVPIGRWGKKLWDRRIVIDPDFGFSEETISRRFIIVKEPFMFPRCIRRIAAQVRVWCDFVCNR